MIPLSPPLLIAAAGSFIGAGAESETTRGRLLDLIFTRVGHPNDGPWSAAFIHHVGYWSHYDFRTRFSSWPLPATNDPRDLEAFAVERNILRRDPKPGDVFLAWSPALRRLTRAGVVVWIEERLRHPRHGNPYWRCVTVEGDTTEFGAPTGRGIHALRRNLSTATGDRFLRWIRLDARDAVADPSAETKTVSGRIVLRRAA